MILHKIFYPNCWLHYRMKISSSIITFGWVLIAAFGITGQQLCLLSSLPPIWQLFLSISRVIRSVHNSHIGNGAAMKSMCVWRYRYPTGSCHTVCYFSQKIWLRRKQQQLEDHRQHAASKSVHSWSWIHLAGTVTVAVVAGATAFRRSKRCRC